MINSFIELNMQEINDLETLLDRLRHKEIISYHGMIKVDYIKEMDYIVENFNQIFSHFDSFSNIDEKLWKIISIRLSIDVEV